VIDYRTASNCDFGVIGADSVFRLGWVLLLK